jgi:uncharacterized protein YdeI (YjbR/CyaY-like superfamily)
MRVDQLIKAGLMTKAGLQKIEQAKLDASWAKLDSVEDLTLPQEAPTRNKRLDETARLAAVNERANQWRPKSNSTSMSV